MGLIRQGGYICVARKPKCPECPVRQVCEYKAKSTLDDFGLATPKAAAKLKRVAKPISAAKSARKTQARRKPEPRREGEARAPLRRLDPQHVLHRINPRLLRREP